VNKVVKGYMFPRMNTFRTAKEGGDWHIRTTDGHNQYVKARRKKAGLRRIGKAEFKRRLMRDLGVIA